jgi:hypothetical protein
MRMHARIEICRSHVFLILWCDARKCCVDTATYLVPTSSLTPAELRLSFDLATGCNDKRHDDCAGSRSGAHYSTSTMTTAARALIREAILDLDVSHQQPP